MNPNPVLNTLLQTLDAPTARFTELDRYYAGDQALAFLSPEASKALGNRMTRISANIPRLAVTSLAERLRVIGFSRDGQPDAQLWTDWISDRKSVV